MASDSDPPDRLRPSDSDPVGRQPRQSGGAERAAPPERLGPLEIARYRKDDGRALILYARAENGRS
jgi:hypothetical protein